RQQGRNGGSPWPRPPAGGCGLAGDGVGDRAQGRGRGRLRARDVGGDRGGPLPGGRPGPSGVARPRPLPPAGRPRPPRSGRRGGDRRIRAGPAAGAALTPDVDPWRTLGLAPGATADEVRRAYRRLAKANHPDAAGETALPRFLAIQAAYEQLLGPVARRRPGARPTGRSSPAPSEPHEPWQADPDRARASGSFTRDRRRPGARPGGARPSSRTGDGSGDGRGEGAGGGGATAGSTGAGQSGARASGGTGQTRTRRSGRRRAASKATPYSTSYDAADEEPFEPGWSGATWYGSSSGTYWTINPKEYADPRKHGPEYQRRARRPAGGWILDDSA